MKLNVDEPLRTKLRRYSREYSWPLRIVEALLAVTFVI